MRKPDYEKLAYLLGEIEGQRQQGCTAINELKDVAKMASHVIADVRRLEAALERIAVIAGSKNCTAGYNELYEIAREALGE